jgi:hypothetical protein
MTAPLTACHTSYDLMSPGRLVTYRLAVLDMSRQGHEAGPGLQEVGVYPLKSQCTSHFCYLRA